MPNPAITIDGLEPFQVALRFPAKVPFDRDLVVRDRVNDLVDLLRREVLGPQVPINIRLLENAFRRRRPDAVNVGKRRFDAFVRRYFNSQKSWHKVLSLALLVTRVRADHADNIFPLHDLARYTKSFY